MPIETFAATANRIAENHEAEQFAAKYALSTSNLSTRNHYGTDEALKTAAIAAVRKAKRSTKVRTATRELKEEGSVIRTTHPEFPSVAVFRKYVEVKYRPDVPLRAIPGGREVHGVTDHDRVALYLPLYFHG